MDPARLVCEIIPPSVAITLPTEPPITNAVGILTRPEQLRSFVAVVTLKTKNRKYHRAVIMPGFDDRAEGIYEVVRETLEAGGTLRSTLTTLQHDLGYIADHRFVTYPSRLWQRTIPPSSE